MCRVKVCDFDDNGDDGVCVWQGGGGVVNVISALFFLCVLNTSDCVSHSCAQCMDEIYGCPHSTCGGVYIRGFWIWGGFCHGVNVGEDSNAAAGDVFAVGYTRGGYCDFK